MIYLRLFSKALFAWLTFVSVFFTGCSDRPGGDGGGGSGEMVLRHILTGRIETLDPAGIHSVHAMMVAGQIFEPLYTYHYLKRPYELIPLLAEDLPEISDDMLTYTIRIKKGVYFHNDACFPRGMGRGLTAHDFVFAVKRLADVKTLSPNWSLFDGRILGLDEFREYTKTCGSAAADYSFEVDGFKAIDDYTIVIRLNRPWPQLVGSVLTHLSTSPLPWESLKSYGRDIINHPVGTGPYKLREWRRDSFIELVRSENWRGESYPDQGQSCDIESGYLNDAGKSIPFADRIVWRVVEESQPAWLLFLDGQIDAISVPKDVFGDVIDISSGGSELSDSIKSRNIRLKTFMYPSVFWIGFNMKDSVISSNRPLRMAISRAIDRRKFIALFRNARDLPAHGLIPPMLDCYDPAITGCGYSAYDPDESIRLLEQAEAIYGGRLPHIRLGMPGVDTFNRQYGDFLRQQLNAVGIEVEISYMDWAGYLSSVNSGGLQMFASGISGEFNDAIDFLSMFSTRYLPPGVNKFFYSNPEYDQLFEEACTMPAGPGRTMLYRRMERIILDDYVAVFMNHRMAYVLHHDWYLNFKPHALSYNLSKYRRIDTAGRDSYKELIKGIR